MPMTKCEQTQWAGWLLGVCKYVFVQRTLISEYTVWFFGEQKKRKEQRMNGKEKWWKVWVSHGQHSTMCKE